MKGVKDTAWTLLGHMHHSDKCVTVESLNAHRFNVILSPFLEGILEGVERARLAEESGTYRYQGGLVTQRAGAPPPPRAPPAPP